MEWTNRLGNFALLSNRKNPKASNKPFPPKYEDYFEKKSDFVLTGELEVYNDRNVQLLKERHYSLIREAKRIWLPSN